MILIYSGHITDEEMLDVRATLGNHPAEAEKCRFLLVDLADATLAQLLITALKQLAELHKALAEHTVPGMPVAVVAGRDLEYGLARMWQVFVEENGWETMVFRSRKEAQRWLSQKFAETSGDGICELRMPETPRECGVGNDCNGPGFSD